jgi:tRNA (guanine37-N1)-methyltransferase
MSTSTNSKPVKEIVLDRNAFKQNIDLIALRIPAKQCSNYLNQFKDFLFERPRFKRIYESPDGNQAYRLLLLSESIKSEEELIQRLSQTLIDFHNEQVESAREANDERPTSSSDIESHDTKTDTKVLKSVYIHQITLGYEHFGADEVLHRLLDGLVEEVPTAFEQAGHIAHMNLREESLPYKNIVGQVIIDKNPSIKTVVNKIGNIETEFRTFPLEVSPCNLLFG